MVCHEQMKRKNTHVVFLENIVQVRRKLSDYVAIIAVTRISAYFCWRSIVKLRMYLDRYLSLKSSKVRARSLMYSLLMPPETC